MLEKSKIASMNSLVNTQHAPCPWMYIFSYSRTQKFWQKEKERNLTPAHIYCTHIIPQTFSFLSK